MSAGDAAALPARSTADGVASGTQIGLCGAIERIIAEYRRQQAPNGTLKVVLCGGDAPLLLPLLTGIDQHVPDLVLRGLALLARGRP